MSWLAAVVANAVTFATATLATEALAAKAFASKAFASFGAATSAHIVSPLLTAAVVVSFIVSHVVTFLESSSRYPVPVHEKVLTAIILSDEAKPLCIVKELHGTGLRHDAMAMSSWGIFTSLQLPM